MKSRLRIRLYTLVQHSGFGLAGNPQFQHAVEEACVTSRREVDRVRKAGGVLLDDYVEACQRAEQENYPPWVNGLIPHVSGTFAKARVGGLRVYVPPASSGQRDEHRKPTGRASNVELPTSNVEVTVECNAGSKDFGVGRSMLSVRRSPGSLGNFRHPADTPAGRQERAVAVFLDPHGFVHQKWEFLRQKGMSDDEILEALNTATGGEVVRAAGLDALRIDPSGCERDADAATRESGESPGVAGGRRRDIGDRTGRTRG